MNKVSVFLNFGFQSILVGTLIENRQKVYFQFDTDFLYLNLDLSPFKLKKTSDIIECPATPFDGISGLFNDSLPDGWGHLLFDRKLTQSGRNPHEISVLEKLTYLNDQAQGALTFQPENRLLDYTNIDINLDDINLHSAEILKNGGNEQILDELYQLGGNSVGARPKMSLNYNIENNIFSTNHDCIENGFQPWIVKFPSLNDFQDIAKIEYVYYKMASLCNVSMSESKLFEGKSGNFYFGTKRFDRIDNEKLHFHTSSGLLHDDFRISTIDYGHIMDAANRLENKIDACVNVFRLAVFNVFSLNMDDHSKNTAFLMDKNGSWKFAPAFDLTFSPKNGSFQSLSVAGIYQSIQTNDLLKLANHFKIENAQKIIEEVKQSLSEWKVFASDLDINRVELNLIEKAIQKKIMQ